MKKALLVFAIASVALVSCKKNRTCTCTVAGESSDTIFQNMSKKDANAKCESYSALVQAFGGGSCKLK